MGERTGRAAGWGWTWSAVLFCLACCGFSSSATADGTPTPVVGLAKEAAPTVYLGDRVFSAAITLTLENMASVTANELRLTDDLAAVFGDAVDWFEVIPSSISSDRLAVNASFDGESDPLLLTGQSSLDRGVIARIHFVVQFRVRNDRGQFENSAFLECAGCLRETSTNGLDPDPSGNRYPSEREPTPIPYEVPQPREALIGLAKAATFAESVAGGQQQTTFTLTLKNYFQSVATSIDLQDDLQQAFASAGGFELVAGSLRSEAFEVNPAFDGDEDMSLLAGGQELLPLQQATVSYTVHFTLTPDTGALFNSATIRAANAPLDTSQNGFDPDPDGDGDPAEQAPTPILYDRPAPSPPLLGLAKAATFGTATAGAERETEITLRLTNYGATAATDVDLQDDLSRTFAGASSFAVVPDSLIAEGLVGNPAYDGASDQALLRPGQTLAPGAEASLTYRVRFLLASETGALFNTAVVSAANAGQDLSQEGSDPDPDGDGDPAEQAPTPIPYEPLSAGSGPVVGLAKRLASLELVGPGRYRGQFIFTLENFGPGAATGLALFDDFGAAFPAPATYSILAVNSRTLLVNERPAHAGPVELLRPQQSLAEGASARISVDFELTADGARQFLNTAFVQSEAGPRDQSTDGPDPDPDSDGDPAEAEPTVIGIEESEPLPLLSIDVMPRPRTTRVGRLVGYTITVTNTVETTQDDVEVRDQTPVGFQAQTDDVLLVRAGPDGRFDTADDLRRPLLAAGTSLVTFAPFPLAPLESVRIIYGSRVTSAARLGPHPNKSLAVSSISGQVDDEAVVDVVADALFDRATIVGKVYHDRNGDGRQGATLRRRQDAAGDPEAESAFERCLVRQERWQKAGRRVSADADECVDHEEGVTGAKIVTPEGLIVHTDAQGRFHIADIEINGRFGENYVLKLDTTSLPLNAYSRSDFRQIIRLTPGGLGKASFAVAWDDRPGVTACCGPFDHLDYLGPTPSVKKLDVALRSIRFDAERKQHDLEVAVQSNYPDLASCVQVRVSPIGGGAAVVGTPQRLLRTRQTLTLSLAGRTHDRFHYRLYAYAPDRATGQCLDLFRQGRRRFEAVDWTRTKIFELPAGDPGVPYLLPDVELESSLEQDGVPLPPVQAQRLVRRYPQGFEVVEVLSATQGQLFDRTTHLWDANVVQQNDSAVLRPGRSLETTGFERPPQEGGPDGEVSIERDQDFFEDGARFFAEGLDAAMTCCDIKTTLQSVVDAQNIVTAFRIGSEHTEDLEICFLPQQRRRRSADYRHDSARCWDEAGEGRHGGVVTLRAGQTLELLEVRFEEPDWLEMYVFIREQDPALPSRRSGEHRLGYKVSRQRGVGQFWSLPKTIGICGTVSSAIDITVAGGLAAQKLTSSDDPIDLDPLEEPLRSAEVRASDLYLGVVDLTLGGSSASGSLKRLAASNRLGDSLFAEGRIAGYWRGNRALRRADRGAADSSAVLQQRERQLSWVLQLDSTRDDLEDLGSNLTRKDPRRLFRQLDSESYYPTYGDDSTTLLDTDSQGAFYARVELDDHRLLWGNYDTDFSGTEFAQFNRTLYGFNGQLETAQKTASGASRFTLRAFGAEAQSASARESFLATGGSLYYLRNTDIVLGSEKLWIELRRRDTEQVEERRALVAGRDYEIDPVQGRILLSRPLNQVVRDRYNPVVRTEVLQGDTVVLFAEYEYLPAAFSADDLVFGLRGRGWVNDYLALGATHVTDEQGGTDYQLSGIDLLLRKTDDTYLSLEYATTDADRDTLGLLSLDGGLTFTDPNLSAGIADGGAALGFEGQLALADFMETPGLIRAWWKRREAGYSSSRYALGPAVYDTGFDFEVAVDPSLRLLGGATRLERLGISDRRTARLQIAKEWGCQSRERCWLLDLEGRRDEVRLLDDSVFSPALAGTREGDGTVLGLRLARRLSTAATVYGTVQKATATDAAYGDNDLIALGLNQRLNDRLAVSVEGSDGDRGSALIAGVDFSAGAKAAFNLSSGVGPGALTQIATNYALSDGQELYGTFSVSPDRTDGDRNLLTLGQRHNFGRRAQVYTESQFGHVDRQTNTGHLFGLDFGIAEDLVLATTLQASRVEGPNGSFDRSAISFGGTYGTPDLRLSSRLEQRRDQGSATDLRQYVWTSLLSLRLGDSGRLLGKVNAALLDDALSDLETGRFAEVELGYAYRPVASDRFNGMLRYAFLYDVATQGQSDAPGDERAHVLSGEGLFELTPRIQLGGKIAGRLGESRIEKGRGAWQDVRLSLASARLLFRLDDPQCRDTDSEQSRCLLPDQLEVLTEYRWLRDWRGENSAQGLLLGIYKQFDSRRYGSRLPNSLRVGAGYNFSGFNDDLERNRYRSHGWFIDFTAAF